MVGVGGRSLALARRELREQMLRPMSIDKVRWIIFYLKKTKAKTKVFTKLTTASLLWNTSVLFMALEPTFLPAQSRCLCLSEIATHVLPYALRYWNRVWRLFHAWQALYP